MKTSAVSRTDYVYSWFHRTFEPEDPTASKLDEFLTYASRRVFISVQRTATEAGHVPIWHATTPLETMQT